MLTIHLAIYVSVFIALGMADWGVWNRIIDQVNEHLSENERYSRSIWAIRRAGHGEFNTPAVWRAHARYLPDSSLRVLHASLCVTTLCWMVLGLSIFNG